MTIQKAELDEFDFQVEFLQIPWKLNLVDETLARCEFYSDSNSKSTIFVPMYLFWKWRHFFLQNMDIFWQKLNIFCVKLIENNPTVVPKIDPFETKEDPKQMNWSFEDLFMKMCALIKIISHVFFCFPKSDFIPIYHSFGWFECQISDEDEASEVDIETFPPQCGKMTNLLSLRFYVKSMLENLKVLNLPLLQF